jgi:hypothetical protein
MSEMLVGAPKSPIDQLAEYLDTAGETLVVDSRVVSKNSPDYWLIQLSGEGWKIVSRDAMPVQLPSGQTFFNQVVHFERQVKLSAIKADLQKVIDASRAQMAKAAGIAMAQAMPADMPDISSILAGRR